VLAHGRRVRFPNTTVVTLLKPLLPVQRTEVVKVLERGSTPLGCIGLISRRSSVRSARLKTAVGERK